MNHCRLNTNFERKQERKIVEVSRIALQRFDVWSSPQFFYLKTSQIERRILWQTSDRLNHMAKRAWESTLRCKSIYGSIFAWVWFPKKVTIAIIQQRAVLSSRRDTGASWRYQNRLQSNLATNCCYSFARNTSLENVEQSTELLQTLKFKEALLFLELLYLERKLLFWQSQFQWAIIIKTEPLRRSATELKSWLQLVRIRSVRQTSRISTLRVMFPRLSGYSNCANPIGNRRLLN